MIEKLLIANRGEIAVRIMRTARSLGVRTVAVYSDADVRALHVEMADEAVRIGPAPASESYLNGDLIIKAALSTGAQAIHPGYGFLSENAAFAQAVGDNDLIFVGPSAFAIRAMGLKGEAKAIMQAAGVPVVPGYHGEDQTPDLLAAEAEKIGYPVLIKAVAGGGGKGMRRVDNAAGFMDALASARREALAAFGNDAVLVEKLIERPRHIEVQVFGDGTRAVHLFERDCSLQRRHQKVIEEAPAPGMTEELRNAMTGAAVRAAEAIEYKGAGTIEFIVDAAGGLREDGFWFMEMNTRLQVEHPVSEAVTGIDLVEWQLRVASGEELPLGQNDIRLTGHAIEGRVYAEDPSAGFLPATGRISSLEFPGSLRADTGVRAGDDITPHYDPMIAKVIAHAPDRRGAIRKLADGLETTRSAGTTTNLNFLTRLVTHPEFGLGAVHTGLIEDALEDLSAPPPVPDRVLAVAAVVGARSDDPHAGFSLWAPLERNVELKLGDDIHEMRVVTHGPDHFSVVIAGAVHRVSLGDGWAETGGTRAPLWHDVSDTTMTLIYEGRWTFDLTDQLAIGDVSDMGGDAILAPMPGLVRSLGVAPGDKVTKGQALGLMEAMKMELTLRAPRDGRVEVVAVSPGSQVEAGTALITLWQEDNDAKGD